MSTKWNSSAILEDMQKVLTRYRAGLIEPQQARQELSILAAMMKAYETVVLEARLSKLESVVGGRDNGRY